MIPDWGLSFFGFCFPSPRSLVDFIIWTPRSKRQLSWREIFSGWMDFLLGNKAGKILQGTSLYPTWGKGKSSTFLDSVVSKTTPNAEIQILIDWCSQSQRFENSPCSGIRWPRRNSKVQKRVVIEVCATKDTRTDERWRPSLQQMRQTVAQNKPYWVTPGVSSDGNHCSLSIIWVYCKLFVGRLKIHRLGNHAVERIHSPSRVYFDYFAR